jgi:hypothetical protein
MRIQYAEAYIIFVDLQTGKKILVKGNISIKCKPMLIIR